MPALNYRQVAELAAGAWPPDQVVTATAVAFAESGRKVGGEWRAITDAVGDRALADETWGPSIGLWQVRSLHAQQGSGLDRDVSRLFDPSFNAQAAASIWRVADGWRPWTAHNTGAYREHLDAARQAYQAIGAPAGDDLDAGLQLPSLPTPGSLAADATGQALGAVGLGWLTTADGRRRALTVGAGLAAAVVAVVFIFGDDVAERAEQLAGAYVGASTGGVAG